MKVLHVYAQDRGTGNGGNGIEWKGQLWGRKGFRAERASESGHDISMQLVHHMPSMSGSNCDMFTPALK